MADLDRAIEKQRLKKLADEILNEIEIIIENKKDDMIKDGMSPEPLMNFQQKK